LRAIKELKFLTKKLKFAVPISEFEKVSLSSHNYKNKCADLMERSNRLTKQLSDQQTKMRNLQTAEARLQLYEEM
jgi:Ca2+-binding EF-hand superfamily protein